MASERPILSGPIIRTAFIGPTNHRPSRVSATHQRDSERTYRVMLPWDHALNSEANHQAAAQALLARFWPDSDLVIVGRGHDASRFYWLTVGAWQLTTIEA
jgi:hypothetical protein